MFSHLDGTGLRSMHMERRSGPAVVAAIQSEIMERGPVTALFIVYDVNTLLC